MKNRNFVKLILTVMTLVLFLAAVPFAASAGTADYEIECGDILTVDYEDAQGQIYVKFVPEKRGVYKISELADYPSVSLYDSNKDFLAYAPDKDDNACMNICLEADETYYIGFSLDAEVTWAQISVEEADTYIEYIEVGDVSMDEMANGYYESGYDYDNDEYLSYYIYYVYSYEPSEVKIYYKDGTVTDNESKEYNGYDDIYSYRYDADVWTAGNTYSAGYVYCDVIAPYNVTVTEGNVESIEVGDVTVEENSNGSIDTLNDVIYDSESGEYEEFSDKWFRYRPFPEYVKINYKDDTSETYTYDNINELPYSWDVFTNQDYYNCRWTTGEHTALFSVGCFDEEFDVTVTESNIESIEADTVEITEYSDGYFEEEEDENGNYVKWYKYVDIYPEAFTVNLKDGSKERYTYDELVDYLGAYDVIYYETDQSYENQWSIGDHTATLEICNYVFDYTVRITESNVKSITVSDFEIAEGTNGDYEAICDGDDCDTDGYWFRYYYNPQSITVEYKDGSTEEYNDVEALCGALGYEWLDYEYEHDQSADNPWKVGTHKVTLTIGVFTCDYNIEIVPVGITSIEAVDFSVTEYTNGYYEYDGSDRYYYYINPDVVSVTYNNGLTEEVDFDDLINSYEFNYMTLHDQSEENLWDTGKHSVKLYVGGSFETEYEIDILPTDIESISVDDFTVVEGTDGYTEYEYVYDYDTGEDIECEWFCYYAEPEEITVNYKDGTSETYSYDEIGYDTGFEPVIISGQSYTNQWSVGEHTVTLRIGKVSCTYTVVITEYPYVDFIFEKSTYKEGTNGHYCPSEDDDGNESHYFHYYAEPEKFTVVKKDGTRETYEYSQSKFEEITHFYPQYSDAQSVGMPWGVGTYVGYVEVNGKTYEREVEIVSNGITAVDVIEAYAEEGVNGGYVLEEKNGENVCRFEYSPYISSIKLTVDGETIETTLSDFYDETDVDSYCYIPNQDSQLSYGKHPAILLIGNQAYDFEVELKEGPVESIEVEKITLMEKIDADSEWYYDENTGEDCLWRRYNYSPESVKLVYKDGTTETYTYDELYLSFMIYDDQSYYNPWEAGVHKAKLAIGGAVGEFDVEITKINEEYFESSVISVGDTKTAVILPNNKTFFKFVPDLSGEYSFFSVGDEDTYGWLYNEDFELIAENDDYDGDYNFNIVHDLEAGKTYYFATRYWRNASKGSFEVTLSGQICNHEFKNYKYNNDATCTQNGTKTAVCEYCIKTDTILAENTKLGHEMKEWTTVKEADCTGNGERKRDCSRCPFTETEEIPSKGHKDGNAVRENETKPTCTKEGRYQSVVYCTVCKTELSRTDVAVGVVPHTWIPASCTSAKKCSVCKTEEGSPEAHKVVTVPAVAASCTEKGYTEGEVCGICGTTITAQKEISPKGHSEVIVAGKAPTCTEKGLTNGKACSVCSVIIEERKEISALGHSFTEADGKKLCSICGIVVELPTTPVTKPSTEETTKPDVEDTTKPSTEETTKPDVEDTTKPSTEETTKPDAEDTTKPSEPEHKHTEIVVKGKAASCTDKGLTDGKKCSECGQITVAQKEIPATGHKEVILEAVAATYTKTGLTEGKKCSACGEILAAQKSVSRKKLKKASSLKVKKTASTSVTLSWKKVEGADSYKVYYSTDGKKWKSVKVKKNTATIKKLKSGTQYRFKVRAFVGKYYGAESKIIKKTTKVKKPVISKVTSSKKNTAVVSWKNVTRASGYVVEYSTSKKFSKKTTKTVKIKKGKTTKATLKKLKSGKKYYVRVKAYKTVNKKASYGSYSAVKTVKVK